MNNYQASGIAQILGNMKVQGKNDTGWLVSFQDVYQLVHNIVKLEVKGNPFDENEFYKQATGLDKK